MGDSTQRQRLMDEINLAFNEANIEATATRLTPLLELDADVFELLAELGFMTYVRGQDIATYRRRLPIPALHKRVLTLAFREALLFRHPLRITIISRGNAEAVRVAASNRLIEVELTRVD